MRRAQTQSVQRSRLWIVSLVCGALLTSCGGEGLEGTSGAATSQSGTAPIAGDRLVVMVHDTAGLLANIGRDNIELVLAPVSTDPGGRYVIPKCTDDRIGERFSSCGAMQQGDDSVLRSTFEPELDGQGVPTGNVLEPGAIIDCSQLPFVSYWVGACLYAGNGSTIRNLVIDGGPGASADTTIKRNNIEVSGGVVADIIEVASLNSRRGVFFTGGSGKSSGGSVQSSLISVTELAGIFVWLQVNGMKPESEGIPLHNSTMEVSLTANRLMNIGVHPILYAFKYGGGSDNTSHVDIIDNVIDVSDSGFGISILTRDFSESQVLRNNTGSFTISGGRIIGPVSDTGGCQGPRPHPTRGVNLNRGLSIIMTAAGLPATNTDNVVTGSVDGITFENTLNDVFVTLDDYGTRNRAAIEMTNSAHTGTCTGRVFKVTDTPIDGDFQIEGSADDFTASNPTIDVSGVLEDFTE